MVWDTGTWESLGDAREMLNKGDLKFRLHGKKLNGEFVLAKMRSRRPGSKGTEWLLIKKKDEAMKPGFDIDKLDYSVLTQRSLKEIGGDEGSEEWESNRKARVRKGAEWLVNDKKTSAKPAANSKTASKNGRGTHRKKSSIKKKPRRAA
jgi:bifunctional non-homologous end joining protein LigD